MGSPICVRLFSFGWTLPVDRPDILLMSMGGGFESTYNCDSALHTPISPEFVEIPGCKVAEIIPSSRASRFSLKLSFVYHKGKDQRPAAWRLSPCFVDRRQSCQPTTYLYPNCRPSSLRLKNDSAMALPRSSIPDI